MAKEEKEEKQEKQEKQVPEKPRKVKSGDVGIIQLVGIIAGTVVVMVIVIFLAFRFLILPELNMGAAPTKSDSTEVKQEDEKSEGKDREEEYNKKHALPSKSYDVSKAKFSETGRITTNPKNSSQFVVINLGLIFTPEGEEESGGHGGGSKDPLPEKAKAMVKGMVNSVLGSMTADELQLKRDSLTFIFYDRLGKVLFLNELNLNEVVLQEFIIQ